MKSVAIGNRGSSVKRNIIKGKSERKKLKAIEFALVTISLSSFTASEYTNWLTLYIEMPEKPGIENRLDNSIILLIMGSFDRLTTQVLVLMTKLYHACEKNGRNLSISS